MPMGIISIGGEPNSLSVSRDAVIESLLSVYRASGRVSIDRKFPRKITATNHARPTRVYTGLITTRPRLQVIIFVKLLSNDRIASRAFCPTEILIYFPSHRQLQIVRRGNLSYENQLSNYRALGYQ